jgi:NADPH2:quinone reductase
MKVVEISKFGGPEVLQVVERPAPDPGRGQALIKVQAAGVNFAETLMRQNRYAVTPSLPVVLGSEVVGTVERLGPDTVGPAIGTRVAGALFEGGGYAGGYAELAAVDVDLLVPVPEELASEDATALMVQGLTALYLEKLAPAKGKTVLVNAAAGGVGSLLIQIVKRAGAKRIIAGASEESKLQLARSLGADAGVNYTHPDWVARTKALAGGVGPDVIYDSVGGSVTAGCLEALASLGELVIYGALNIQSFQLGVAELVGMIFKNQSIRGFAVMPLLTRAQLRADLATLFEMAVHRQLNVHVGAVVPLERAADAHRALDERRSVGKLVLRHG